MNIFGLTGIPLLFIYIVALAFYLKYRINRAPTTSTARKLLDDERVAASTRIKALPDLPLIQIAPSAIPPVPSLAEGVRLAEDSPLAEDSLR